MSEDDELEYLIREHPTVPLDELRVIESRRRVIGETIAEISARAMIDEGVVRKVVRTMRDHGR